MFSGRSVWEFKLRRKATREDALGRLLPVWDFGEPKSVETPYGRLTTGRFGNLTMLDASRIEELPLDSIVQEFEFGAQDYKLVRRHTE
jgi:hypothetical protein